MLKAAYKHLDTTLRAIDDVNTGINGQIYRDIAPSGAAMPYCVINLNNGGMTNGAIRFNEGDTLWTVKFVGLQAQHATAMRGWVGQVFDAMHETMPGVVDDWYLFLVTCETVVEYVERDGDVVYLHTGANYRVRLSK
ncbi:hypothetical protein G4Y79_15300 [Phototrophicus methaneseepsis]|uniref:Uncharacterized protein n=1 Tax=Phototrophicus methaneseepsis TaxID=2710758 RepID=A0A7S8E636_9CHLR|nr:hypothetical protein [Phototrophicus methaneseepsis]QPC81069.1 hypothetical protein G4Y79_15300 [Phototrophicus methaneseepsis]